MTPIEDASNLESPIEIVIYEAMREAFDTSIVIGCQHPVRTPRRNYRADFWIEHRGVVRVVELDGKLFHEFNGDRDRDISFLAGGGVDEVYRFRGCDVHHRVDNCISVLRSFAPDLFEPSRVRPSPGEMSLMAMLFYVQTGPMPIVRCRLPQSHGLARMIDERQTGSVLAEGHDAIIAQFKSPYWHQQKSEPSSHRLEMRMA